MKKIFGMKITTLIIIVIAAFIVGAFVGLIVPGDKPIEVKEPVYGVDVPLVPFGN
jgi:hypothetical protein